MSTLSLPEVWPTVLRQAFDEEFIMSTILCVAAAHLAVLSPQEPKYSSAKSQLLPKSLRLLRLGLSRPITKQTCDALAGTTVLVNYISWCNLDFLAEQHISHHPGGSDTTTGLDLSQDQLFLLSPGVLQVYLQGLPVFIEHDSVFLTIGKQHPRINIENVLAARGEDATRFVEPFMKMWDDPRYMTCSAPAGDQASSDTPFRRTWSFFSEVESELYRTYDTSSRPKDVMLVYYGNTPEETRDAILRVQSAKNSNAAGDIPTPESQPGEVALGEQALIPRRTAFERVVRRLSPLLSCLSAPQGSANAFPGAPMPRQADLQRLIFTFPVFCCGAMLELVAAGDARTLIMLYHFYRAVRILLPTEESWWAGERSRHLEGLILAELKARGYDACLR
ncbi:hypothetical protein QQS21_012610 [Conoideocrella luteorostrata]|uniref:Uncharacterized protein n=1 Tax=Conoideocrella luteorostrata TaxID=1105319 RepID=A0AAJ0CD70_9HYPO|nr:hypothetical protein QQS21_012610 [Conoideocrella luteorostrata]